MDGAIEFAMRKAGVTELKEKQKECMVRFLEDHDVFVPRGIVAEYVGEAQEDPSGIADVLGGQVQLVFISPESIIMNQKYRNMLLSKPYKENLVALVIDEAHCQNLVGVEV